MIYHYTSQATAKTIIECGTIRLSNMAFLNDGREFWLAKELFERYVKERDGNGQPILAHVLKEFNFLEQLDLTKEIPSFNIACFTESGDDAAQWHRYGDNGRGVALGFEEGELSISLMQYEIESYKVIYELGAQMDQIDKAIREIEQQHPTEESIQGVKLPIPIPLLKKFAVFKDKSFAVENETRFIAFAVSFEDLKYFSRDGHLIPHIDVGFGRTALKHIVIGPDARLESMFSWTNFLRNVEKKGGFFGDPMKSISKSKSSLRFFK
jgi:hypothetical protein